MIQRRPRSSQVINVLSPRAQHPGLYVRVELLAPKGLNVTEAAKLVGVGRPAFSNFLNGRAAATPEMAARLEIAFGVKAQALLDMQATFDAESARARGVPADATPYAVPFLRFKARDIEEWARRNISFRSRLAVLIRTLVNSTGREITRIDFPGNDDAERTGWDGEVEAAQGTPWVPAGPSGWEFGTNEDPKSKADGDYAKSLRAVSKSERAKMTFVFVTPRHWPARRAWEKANKQKGQWLDVRAYDSNDLEQWLEQSIAGQAWFAHETGRPAKGVRALEQCWSDWADVADPPFPRALFSAYLDDRTKRAILERLSAEPNGPTTIAADSTDEALAFVAHFFRAVDEPEIAALRDRVLVFDEPGVAKDLSRGTTQFVAVAHTREVELELAPLMRTIHCIVVCPRNAVNVEPHVTLEPLNSMSFEKSLEEVGLSRDRVIQLNNESGRSLTVLRRRLAVSDSIRTPEWAHQHDVARALVPFIWVGSWSATKNADQKLLALMAGVDTYEQLERECQRLVQLDAPPLWSVGHYRGVVSKIDLLFTAARVVLRSDLERFFKVAEVVLSEDDPKLDLPDDKQWAAAVYGKSREFSGSLRRGIAETLVLLSVHGNRLFWERIGFDCEAAARSLVRRLLDPLKTRLLEANDSDLAAYAEAAPDEFLSIIEADLQADAPEAYGLMRPASALFGGCPRTGLLWALEGLAWNPTTMPRVAHVLAQLSEIEIEDNWVNKPFHSLEAIFRAWMPQTSVLPLGAPQ
jgi:addiction module HigA family antidote